jgi:uncharacterized protein
VLAHGKDAVSTGCLLLTGPAPDGPAALWQARSVGVTSVDYRLISVDDHIDLQYLPEDLWLKRLPASLQERAPQVTETPNGLSVWRCEGRTLGRWAGGRSDRDQRSYQTAIERAGLDEPGVLRPTTAPLRLADMDRDDIETSVMYGPVAALDVDDPGLRREVYRAYNDWLGEFCAESPDRLIGVAMLPAEDAAACTAEVVRLAGKGEFRQVSMHIARTREPIQSETWAPFWDAIAETGLIASFHLVLTRELLAGLDEQPSRIFGFSKCFIEQFLDPLVGILGEGVLERRPGVRLVLAESGLGWPPWVVQEMDYRYARLLEMREHWDTRGGVGLTMAPSEVFRRQVWLTFQDDQIGLDLLRYCGPDKVMWACDYPHPDSTFPYSKQVIERLTADLPADVRRALLRDNAAALYGLTS